MSLTGVLSLSDERRTRLSEPIPAHTRLGGEDNDDPSQWHAMEAFVEFFMGFFDVSRTFGWVFFGWFKVVCWIFRIWGWGDVWKKGGIWVDRNFCIDFFSVCNVSRMLRSDWKVLKTFQGYCFIVRFIRWKKCTIYVNAMFKIQLIWFFVVSRLFLKLKDQNHYLYS